MVIRPVRPLWLRRLFGLMSDSFVVGCFFASSNQAHLVYLFGIGRGGEFFGAGGGPPFFLFFFFGACGWGCVPGGFGVARAGRFTGAVFALVLRLFRVLGTV